LAVVITGYRWYRIIATARQAEPHVRNLWALRDVSPSLWLSPSALSGIGTDVHETRHALEEVRRWAKPELALLGWLQWVPTLGADLAGVPLLLDAGVESAAMADSLVQAAQSVLAINNGRPIAVQDSGGNAATGPALEQARAQLEAALEHLDGLMGVLDRWKRLSPGKYVAPRLNPYLVQIEPAFPLARSALEGVATHPEVLDAALGLTGPRTYLLLLQNPWEMRPTGGFVSAAVEVQVAAAKVEIGPFLDSWYVDLYPELLPPPPASLYRAIWTGKINFLNVNWSPHFPTTADWAQRLYQIGRQVELDGVIALDPTLLELLLEAIGPVTVPDLQVSVSAQNLWEQMIAFHDSPLSLRDDASPGERLQRRKEFLPLIAGPLIGQFRAAVRDPARMIKIFQAIQRALDERHLLIASNDPVVAGWLNQAAWDGAVGIGDGDYLQVVDSNVGFNKTDFRVSRQVDYQVSLSNTGQATATLVITYHNHSQVPELLECVQELPTGGYSGDWVDGCYWDYLRVLVPAGSRLLQAEPEAWPPNTVWQQQNPGSDPGVSVGWEEPGRQVFGLMLLVPPGDKVAARFTYLLPPDVLASPTDYRLHFQKQSGTIAVAARVRLNLPEGATVTDTNSWFSEGQWVVETDLRTDLEFIAQLSGISLPANGIAARPTPTKLPVTPTNTPTATAGQALSPLPSPTRAFLLVTATPSPTPGATQPAPAATPAVPAGTPVNTRPVAPVVGSRSVTWSRIQIPASNTDGMVVQVGWQLVGPPDARRAEWEVAAYAAGHHQDSAYPGEVGNVVLSGHHNILGEVFRDLWALQPGDRIYLTDSSGQVHLYVTRQVLVLRQAGASAEERAVNLSYLQRRSEAILTLVTCWPYEGNSHRTFVVADYAGTVAGVTVP
jgi:sortase A